MTPLLPSDDSPDIEAIYGVDPRTYSAWHESGHATVALGLGYRVVFMQLDQRGHNGRCGWEGRDPARFTRDEPERQDLCRQGGAISVAGAAATKMRRAGLGLPVDQPHEEASFSDRDGFERCLSLSPESPEQFLQACFDLAADTLEAHRPAFLALVDALLEHGELDEAEILAVWKRATAGDAG